MGLKDLKDTDLHLKIISNSTMQTLFAFRYCYHDNDWILILKETKCISKRQLINEDFESLIHINGYESFWAFGQSGGSNGQATVCKFL